MAPEPTPEAWAQIRHDYENTDRPLAHICAEHDISIPMLRYRMKRWEWRRRKPLVPRHGPPAVLIMPLNTAPPINPAAASYHPTPTGFAKAQPIDPPPPGEGKNNRVTANVTSIVQPPVHRTPAGFAGAQTADLPPSGESQEAIVPRLQSAVARVLPAIEATIARLAAGPHNPREMEQAGRTLSSLTRTLRELNGLLAQQQASTVAARADDDLPEDMDEIRYDLARRIDAFMRSRAEDPAAFGEDEEAKPPET